MAKLMLSREDTMLGSWFIEDKRLVIGRAEGCEIRLDDQAVSKQHAAIDVMGNDHIVLDLGSANGTVVNGSRVTRHLLQHGDTVEILGFQIRYVDHKSFAGAEGDRTMIFRGNEADVLPVAGSTPPPAPEARAVEIAWPVGMLRTSSKSGVRSIGLDRCLTPLGTRGKDYAAIFRRPDGFSIARVSGRPPRLDGKSIGEGWQPLPDGAVIEIGGDKFKLRLAGAAEEQNK